MELKGQVEEFIYQNEVNSYTICTFGTEDELVTIVGYLPFINEGDTLKLIGNYVTHQEYGRQFKVETFEKCLPETIDGIERYLAGGVIKGIGPATAKRIVSTFGEETIYILKHEPQKLANIRGISEQRATEIVEEFNEKWELWQIVGFLEKFGISASNCKKVYDALGNNAIEQIEQNPYILIDITYGVNFNKIDKMAMELGIDEASPKRIESAIKYSINLASNNGHTCVLKQNLINYVKELLKIEETQVNDAIINLNAKQQIVIEKRNDDWVYLYSTYKAEENIAEHLLRLQKCKNSKKINNIDREIRKQEKINKIELSKKQKEAINIVNENNVCVITGGPGTGKTTIIKSIIKIFKEQKMKVVLGAPTGRAAKRMQETTGEEAKTIHRLLEIGKIEEDKNIIEYEVTPIDADIIIIDEMSMVDIYLMNYLIKAIYLGTKLVLVGDENQLPSVGPGKILKDIIASEKIPIVVLDKIFRQAAKSQIIVNAHRVNNGERFISKDEKEEDSKDDFFYIKENIQEKIMYQVLSLAKERLLNYGDYNFINDIQVLTPTKKGLLGTKELNKHLQEVINPKSEYKNEKTYGDIVYREGDRVMQIKNNYDIYWEKINCKSEHGVGVFNGDIGIIDKIFEEDKQLKIVFDDEKVVWYTFTELDQIEHAYSITIHKSQGSEFDVVIIVVPKTYQMLLTRNLLYTGITRAKKLLVVIGGKDTIDYMIENADIRQRNTGLEYKLGSSLLNQF